MLALAMSGRIDKQIATEMGISLGTVRVYWKRIRMKVGGTRSEVIADLARSSLKLDFDDQRERAIQLERDLDESIVRERKLRIYEAAFESFPTALAILDDPTGEIVRANSAFAELHGYQMDEMVGLESSDLVSSEAQSQYAKQIRATARDGQRLQIPATRRRKDGSAFEAKSTISGADDVWVLTVLPCDDPD